MKWRIDGTEMAHSPRIEVRPWFEYETDRGERRMQAQYMVDGTNIGITETPTHIYVMWSSAGFNDNTITIDKLARTLTPAEHMVDAIERKMLKLIASHYSV